ncbi:MAG: type I-E CRISPR-associated protein Cas6/Cse3/CasE [Thiohalomonadaceae bacterium]
MSALHLVRLPLNLPGLLRFAAARGVTHGDDGLGYSLHLWLTALFGEQAPKPFRYFDRNNEVLGYARLDHRDLLDHARAFAPPEAWAALHADDVASKPMPTNWQVGRRLRVEVLACPVERHGQEEKDAFLRALERQGDAAPARGEVYRAWFVRRWYDALDFEHVELRGMRSRQTMVRRARNGSVRLLTVERPLALFAAQASISNPQRFAELLARGIGRHRAFGFGMVLLAPPS